MSKASILRWGSLTATAIAFGAAGVIAGMFVPQEGIRGVVSDLLSPNKQDDPTKDDAADHANVVEISAAAARNVDMRFRLVETSSHTRYLRVPAFVREIPGLSERTISTRLAGIVTDVFVLPGQKVVPNQEICRVRLTDQRLHQTQASLLEAERRIEVHDAEIKRLSEAAAQGGTAKRRKIEEENKRKLVVVSRDTREQELLALELSKEQIDSIRESKMLLREIVIRVPDRKSPAPLMVSHLHVEPGKSVAAGATVCGIADHGKLYFEGRAFPRDLALLMDLLQNKKTVRAAFADDHRIENLRIVQVANEPAGKNGGQQVIRFSVPLENKTPYEFTGPNGKPFLSWKYRPGLRGHIEIPAEVIKDHYVLPRDAVAEDAGAAFVYRRMPSHSHGDEEPAEVFEPLPVRVLMRDRKTIVVAAGEKLSPGSVIAWNNAWILYLQQNRGGGGHGHAHPHPH